MKTFKELVRLTTNPMYEEEIKYGESYPLPDKDRLQLIEYRGRTHATFLKHIPNDPYGLACATWADDITNVDIEYYLENIDKSEAYKIFLETEYADPLVEAERSKAWGLAQYKKEGERRKREKAKQSS